MSQAGKEADRLGFQGRGECGAPWPEQAVVPVGSKEGHWLLGSDWQQSPDDSKLRHWMASKLRGAVKKGCRAGGQGGQALWPVSCSRWPSLPWPLPGGWKQAVSQFCANISQGASAQGSFRNHSLVGRTVLECLPLLCLPLAASLPPSLLSPSLPLPSLPSNQALGILPRRLLPVESS